MFDIFMLSYMNMGIDSYYGGKFEFLGVEIIQKQIRDCRRKNLWQEKRRKGNF